MKKKLSIYLEFYNILIFFFNDQNQYDHMDNGMLKFHENSIKIVDNMRKCQKMVKIIILECVTLNLNMPQECIKYK